MAIFGFHRLIENIKNFKNNFGQYRFPKAYLSRKNIFSFIPKSISSEVFLVWLINYLDSDCKYSQYKQSFFDNLLLKNYDKGKIVSEISINRQSNNMETVLSFHFNASDERQDILLLFIDKESNMVRPEQLDRYKWIYPNCYRYIYYKTLIVTTNIEMMR